MSRRIPWPVVVFLLSCAADPAGASTFRLLSFSERVDQATLILRGRVSRLETFTRGGALRQPGARREKESQLPRSAPAGTAASGSGAPAAAPVELGVEGGTMIFTRVTLQVEEEIYGVAGAELVLETAGGVHGRVAAIVHGMPRFELGRSYLLLLREGFEQAADPIVGVHQGFFEIVRDEARGEEVLLDAAGDFVIGVEEDRIRLRRNASRSTRPAPALAPPPAPESGSPAAARVSPEVLRYFQSDEAPLGLEEFRERLLAAKGGAR